MSKFRMRQTVTILTDQKTDGRHNKGKIVGIELTQKHYLIGCISFDSYLHNLSVFRYKVAFQDCVTNNFYSFWYAENDLGKNDGRADR